MERPAASGEALARMEAEGRRMQSMVESLLQLARTDEANALDFERLDLARVVEAAVETARARASAAIGFERPAAPVVVMANREAMEQIVGILLDNARKHSPPGTPVHARISAESDWARIEVRDEGAGIEEEHLPHIFERFYRAETSRVTGGAGLGLSIARDLVGRHGGSIAVSSWPGQGSVFSVRLPLLKEHPGLLPAL